jgi:hypothetical protein
MEETDKRKLRREDQVAISFLWRGILPIVEVCGDYLSDGCLEPDEALQVAFQLRHAATTLEAAANRATPEHAPASDPTPEDAPTAPQGQPGGGDSQAASGRLVRLPEREEWLAQGKHRSPYKPVLTLDQAWQDGWWRAWYDLGEAN